MTGLKQPIPESAACRYPNATLFLGVSDTRRAGSPATAHKAAMRKAEAKADAAATREAIGGAGEAPEPPLSPLLLLSEPTLEGLQKL